MTFALAGGGSAGLIPGGGSPRSDCYAEFEVQGVSGTSNHVACTDGDPCDADGQCDDVCTFRVALCLNQHNVGECRPTLFRHPPVASVPIRVPEVRNADSVCGAFTDVPVRLSRGRPARKRLAVRAISTGRPKQDKDILFLLCRPRQGACPPLGTTTTTAPRPTSTTTTTRPATTSTTSAVTTTTTTTTTTAPIRCCLRSSPTGAFDSCMLLSATQCSAESGIDVGAGSCSPNPCVATTTTQPTTTTASTTTTATAPPTTTTTVTTTTTTLLPTRCCLRSSPTGAFDSCMLLTAGQCDAESGINLGAGSCSPNPCPPTTTTTAPPTTTTLPPTTTSTAPTTTSTVPTTTSSTTTAPPTTTTSSTTTTTAPTTTSSTTSTTTSSTTTTTVAFTKLSFTTAVGTSNCGGAGLVPAASAPFSGQLYSNTAETTPTAGGALGLGCLYIGGGNATNVPPDKIPDASPSILTVSGGTLSGNAGTGRSDCTLGQSTTSRHCISEVNTGAACTSDAQCEIAAPGSCAPDANCFFGPPLPIPNGGLSTCVLNVIKTNASGFVHAPSGSSSVSLPLVSRVYLTGNATSPCPKCTSGTCKGGANNGGACTAVGTVGTSLDCPPTPNQFLAPLDVDLTPLTSGKAEKTAADGNFCPGQANPGAFGKADARAIVENGSPAGNLSDGMPHPGVLASVFCIPMTGNIAIDIAADLPGPGAIGLNGNARLQ